MILQTLLNTVPPLLAAKARKEVGIVYLFTKLGRIPITRMVNNKNLVMFEADDANKTWHVMEPAEISAISVVALTGHDLDLPALLPSFTKEFVKEKKGY